MARTSEDILSAVLGQPAPAPRVGAACDETDAPRSDAGAAASASAPKEATGSAPGRTERVTISLPAGCRRRYKVWCAEHDVTMSSVFHDHMEALVSGEGEA